MGFLCCFLSGKYVLFQILSSVLPLQRDKPEKCRFFFFKATKWKKVLSTSQEVLDVFQDWAFPWVIMKIRNYKCSSFSVILRWYQCWLHYPFSAYCNICQDEVRWSETQLCKNSAGSPSSGPVSHQGVMKSRFFLPCISTSSAYTKLNVDYFRNCYDSAMFLWAPLTVPCCTWTKTQLEIIFLLVFKMLWHHDICYF